jgi:hypothetical protein
MSVASLKFETLSRSNKFNVANVTRYKVMFQGLTTV